MGFLDRKSQVVDVVLTIRGRRLFADGKLDFAYVSFFDDGIDYDPISTGTLTDSDRETLIHSTPMLEAWVVPDRRTPNIRLEPQWQVFGASSEYRGVPRTLLPLSGSQVDLRCDQVQVDGAFMRSATGFAQIKLEVSDGTLPSEGFSVHVYSSGTDGLRELDPRRDLQGRRALDPFVAVSIDAEQPLAGPVIGKPETLRRGGTARDPSRRRTVK